MEEINKREDHKDIILGSRTFRINKFNALTGSYMLFKLLGVISPIFKTMFKDKTNEDEISGEDIANILGELTKMTKEDFDYIQKNCLMVVTEIYPNNPNPSPAVLDEYGNFGILDYDLPLILNLTIQSLVFNIKGFFSESPLTSSLGGLTTFLQKQKM